MHERGRERAVNFWWRAAEPIPARPGRLAPADDETHDAAPRPAHPAAASGTRHANPAGAPLEPTVAASPALGAMSEPFEGGPQPVAALQRAKIDLGALRPAADVGDADARADGHRDHTASRGRRWRPLATGLAVGSSKSPSLVRRHPLLIAGVAGALLFSGATGFGRHVRPAQSLATGAERMLVASGLGINEIALSGHRHTLDQEIFRALGANGASLILFDVAAARRRVEALPWIESATLTRIMPDKLKVEVTERVPAAAWLDGERVALVDLTGRVLAYVATFVPPELPRIEGPGAPEAAAELIGALARHPAIAGRMLVAHRMGERRWDLELTNGTRVLMAAGPSMVSLDRLVELDAETQVLEQSKQVVDLTMTRSIAVSSPGGAAAGAASAAAATPRHGRPSAARPL